MAKTKEYWKVTLYNQLIEAIMKDDVSSSITMSYKSYLVKCRMLLEEGIEYGKKQEGLK